MSCRTWLRSSGARPCGGSLSRAISTHPEAQRTTAWTTNGQAIPAANSAAPIGGPTSWLTVMKPAQQPGVGDARGPRGLDQHRGERARGGVGEGLAGPEQEQRGQHQRRCRRGRWRSRPRSTIRTTVRAEVGHHHHPAPVEPVGQRAGVQPERAARAAAGAARPARRATGRGSARRSGADRRRGRCRPQVGQSTTAAAAGGTVDRAASEAGTRRCGSQEPDTRRRRERRHPLSCAGPDSTSGNHHVGVEVQQRGGLGGQRARRSPP